MKPSASTSELSALKDVLCAEWDRLNQSHFGGTLAIPEIVVSTRKTFGGYYQPSRHRIVVSWQAYHEHGLEETLNTFRHEVAHVVHPNHSAAFWTLARALGVTKRYASPPVARQGRRYIYACPACERRIERRRRLQDASCAACDAHYNPRYVLRLVATEAS